MTDSLDTSEGEAMPWVKPAQSESGDEDAQTMTKEERALGAFLAAMHDSKLDGASMRAAMLKVLGLEASTAERLHELEQEIAVSDKLLEHRQQLLQAIPACSAHGHGCVPHALGWIEQQKRGATADSIGEEAVAIYHGRCVIDCGDHGHHDLEMLKLIPAGSKLYTRPEHAAQVPLTEQDVDRLIEQHAGGAEWTDDEYRSAVALIRSVEAAHRIGKDQG